MDTTPFSYLGPIGQAKAIQTVAFVTAAQEGRLADVQQMLQETDGLKIDDFIPMSEKTALSAAIESGRAQVVQWLLQQGAEVYAKRMCEAYGALHDDCTSDRESIVQMLHEHRVRMRLKWGVAISSHNEPFNDPEALVYAVRKNKEGAANILIRRGADVNAADSGLTPLTTAICCGHESMVRILLNAGALVDKRASPYFRNTPQDSTPLILAAHSRSELFVRLLIERGASVHEADSKGKTALMYAVERGKPQLITLLLDTGSLINAQSSSAMTALMLSAISNNKEVVSLLLTRGASVGLVDTHSMTALMHAAVTRDVDTMRLLLDVGSPVNAKSDTGETALMLLVSSQVHESYFRPDAIRLLLNHDALIDQVNNQGWTALMIAAFKGHHQSVQTLLKQGASVDIRTDTGDTALTLAQKEDHTEIVKLLLLQYPALAVNLPLQNGHISNENSDGWVSLLQAATIGDDATVVRLLQAKVPIDKQTSTGETALLRAVWNRQAKIARLLIEFGANLELVDHKKWSALMKAVHIGDYEITQLLVEGGAAIDGFGQDGESTLMRAVSKGYEDVARVLIENGANLELKNTSSFLWNNKGWTALMYAASGGFEGIVKLLIHTGAGINPCEDYDESPLMCAARNGHEHVLAVLLNNGALLNTANKVRESALDIAIRSEQEGTARILIDWCANLDQRNVFGSTALMRAAGKGCEDIVSLLLERGASVDAHDLRGTTALMYASRQGHEMVVRLLLRAGASMNQQDNSQYTALMHAAKEGLQDCVRALLPGNGMIDHQDQFGENALLIAAKSGHEGCVLVLLKAGAGVDTQDNYGHSALMKACQLGKIAVIDTLLSRGASTELETFYPNFTIRRRALALAAKEGHDDVVRRLIRANALINAQGSDGRSALSLAAEYGHGRVVEALLANGALVDSTDEKGRTPLMYAAETKHFEVVRILLNSGANTDATDHEQSTAIMLAVLKGRIKTVALLQARGASLTTRNKAGWSTLMLATQFGDFPIMRELLLARSVLKDSIDYLHAGMPKHDPVMNDEALVEQTYQPQILVEQLIEHCGQMRGASDFCLHVCTRLLDVEKQLKAMTKIAQRGPMGAFQQILDQMRVFLVKYSSKTLVLHLVSNEQIVKKCERINQELDTFIQEHGLSPDCVQRGWDEQLQQQAKAYKQHIENSIRTDQNALFDDLHGRDAQEEALMLLLFESDNRESKYSEKELDLMHRIYLHVSSLTKIKISSVPKWFVPPQDVDIGRELARGSYGSVHSGRWNRAEVVVKCAFNLDEHSRGMFLLEMDIWRKLQHPNIIQLYKACHVGDPFFVCEYAENGRLSDFLYRKKNPAKVWEKLLEAARGLLYLHEEHKVVHGDLKCDNILVGGTRSSGDGPAKLTDFGLSFKNSDRATPSSEEVGAIRWKAPEVVNGQTRGSLASDVYSFGMCILEAATGRMPWGDFADATIKYRLLKLKQLPKRPEEINDTQWELISCMCAWEPSERPQMKEVVEALQGFAVRA